MVEDWENYLAFSDSELLNWRMLRMVAPPFSFRMDHVALRYHET
jgi:hypothetical protein